MKEVVDEYVLKEEEQRKKAKLQEQIEELQKILPKEYVRGGWFMLQKIPRFHIESSVSDNYAYIRIRDRKFISLESMSAWDYVLSPIYVEKRGAIVVELHPFDYIKIREKTLYDIIKKFGEKWGYKKLIRTWI